MKTNLGWFLYFYLFIFYFIFKDRRKRWAEAISKRLLEECTEFFWLHCSRLGNLVNNYPSWKVRRKRPVEGRLGKFIYLFFMIPR